MAGNRKGNMFDKEEVQKHIIRQLRKRIREDRPAEKILDLSVLELEEQIEKGELHLEALMTKLEFIKSVDPSILEEEGS